MDHEGVQPDPDKIVAMKNMRTPTCIGDICRLLGMINQLSKFSIHLADKIKPLGIFFCISISGVGNSLKMMERGVPLHVSRAMTPTEQR